MASFKEERPEIDVVPQKHCTVELLLQLLPRGGTSSMAGTALGNTQRHHGLDLAPVTAAFRQHVTFFKPSHIFFG